MVRGRALAVRVQALVCMQACTRTPEQDSLVAQPSFTPMLPASQPLLGACYLMRGVQIRVCVRACTFVCAYAHACSAHMLAREQDRA